MMPRSLRLGSNLILLGLLVIVVGYFIGRNAYDASRLRYVLGEDDLVIRYRGAITIPYRRIETVTFFREPPHLRGSALGIEFGRVRFGGYQVEGVGRVQVYSSDIRRPLLVIRTGEGNYGITPPDGERFYRDLLARLDRAKPETSIGR